MPAVYIAHEDWVWRTMTVVARTTLDPGSLARPLEAAIWSVDPTIPVTRIRTMSDVVSGSIETTRVTGTLFSLFAALALVLGSIGVYGVVAHALGRRRREFGIRVALGASASGVAFRALRRTAVAVTIGLLMGAAVTPSVGDLLSASLLGVRPRAAWLLILTAAVLFSVALAASWIPALRNARVDPAETLHAD